MTNVVKTLRGLLHNDRAINDTPRMYDAAGCEVIVTPRKGSLLAGMVETRFPDGRLLFACVNLDEDSIARARALGYEGDDYTVAWNMTRHHDLLHSLLAEARGQEYSPTLHGVATNDLIPSTDAHDEECIVMLLQHIGNVGVDGVRRPR